MAETSTAEVVREREPAPADTSPALPPPPPPSAPSTPSDPVVAFGQWMASRDKEQQGLDARNAAMAPRIAQTQQALDTRVQQIAQNPPPPPPQLPPPPKRDLSAFLSPREGESAEASVQKLIQAIGLFAGGVGGLAKGDARGSLAAFTGALKGWNEGDIERGDRAFADWQAKTKTALTQWETERASYLDWLAVGNVSVDQMMRGLELQAMQSGNEQAAAAFRSGTLGEGVKFLQQQQQAAADFANSRARIIEAHEARLGREAYQRAHLDIERGKVAATQQQVETAVGAYGNPETLKILGQQYAMTGTLPPNIARAKSGQVIVPKIIAAAAEWARENNIDPMSLPALRADVKTAQTALADVKKREAVAEVAVGTFERHMTQLVDLGRKVDRSQRPVLNRYILKGRGQYQGDADVAAFEAIALEAGQEFAKVSVGTAQGDANTREEARKAINSALNQTQLEKVAEELRRTAQSRMQQYRETEKRLMETISAPGASKKADAPAASPSAAARVVIVNEKGERGSVPADTDLSKYPGWKKE